MELLIGSCAQLRSLRQLLLLVTICGLHAGSTASCPGGPSQPYTWTPGSIPEHLARELALGDGSIQPLARNGVFLDPGPLSHGQSHTWQCRRLHWGLNGSLSLSCSNGRLVADASNCRRTGCPWHHMILGAPKNYTATLGLNVDSFTGGVATSQWKSMVLAGNEAFYALPMNAPYVLRINASSGSVQPLSLSPVLLPASAAYSAAVLGPDGAVYGVPFSASKVVRIDPKTDAVSTFGVLGSSSYKWSHGVLAPDGLIYCLPAFATQVLRVDPSAGSTSLLPGSLEASLLGVRWSWGVVAPTGEIFGVPDTASSVLRIDPFSQTVSTFGNFGTAARKWAHGVMSIDGRIYCVPSSATSVLRVDVRTSSPSADDAVVGLTGLPVGDYKWVQGVAGTDGNIYCIPSSHTQVLVIYPSTAQAVMLGNQAVPGSIAPHKFAGGMLAPDGRIYAFPSNEKKVMRIDPILGTTESIGEDFGGLDEKYGAAAMAPNGDIWAVPSAAKRLLQMSVPKNCPACATRDMCTGMPPATNFTCTLGLPCTVGLAMVPGRDGALDANNAVWLGDLGQPCWIKAFAAITGLPQPLATSTGDVNGLSRSFAFGVGVAGTPGISRLCWAPWLTSVDIMEMGRFELHGPDQGAIRSCSLGMRCDIILQGLGLSPGSVILIVKGACGSNDAFLFSGLTNQHSVTSSTLDTSTNHSIGLTENGTEGVYNLCWAQASSAGSDLPSAAFIVLVGVFRLVGPKLTGMDGMPLAVLECWEGSPCDVLISGTDLSGANRLSIRAAPDCKNQTLLASIAGLTTTAAPSAASGLAYALGIPKEGGSYGTYTLCWHSVGPNKGILFRPLKVYGPIDGGVALECNLSVPCNVTLTSEAVVGVPEALRSTSQLLLVGGEGACTGSTAASLWTGTSNPLTPTGALTFYDLGPPLADTYIMSQAIVQTYSLCWSRTGAVGTFLMLVGTLRIHDQPCQVPRAHFTASPRSSQDAVAQPCTSLDTGLAVSQLWHAETCTPNCATNYDASEPTLRCNYGTLSAPSYDCRARCLFNPYVANGVDQANCIGKKHGDICTVTCPTGQVKSGDLLCSYGRFEHMATLKYEVLFNVPRCYYSCKTQDIGCGGAFGSGEVTHGSTCKPECPTGSTGSVEYITCWDGAADPPSFTCRAPCLASPVVQHSRDLSFCKGAVNGVICPLRCKLGYVKSGDLFCDNGVWSTQQCRVPCIAPSPNNTASPACEDGDIIESGGRCVAQCAEGFAPEIASSPLGAKPSLNCTDGVFSPLTFVCKPSCVRVPEVDYADEDSLKRCIGTMHGQTCSTPCLEGYEKSADILCTNGNFSKVFCVKKCDRPPVVEFSVPSFDCYFKSPNATCNLMCKAGYAVTGRPKCLDGTWTLVECLRMCQAPSSVAYALGPSCAEGSYIKSGSSCTPSCMAGFTPSKSSLSCLRGVFSPDSFQCMRSCGVVPTIQHADKQEECEGTRVGVVCQTQCMVGFRPTGHLRCKADGWHQYKGSMLAETSTDLRRGLLLGTIATAADFILSFTLFLKSRAGSNYQSVLHVTATGENCCASGDRVPVVLLQPALGNSIGDNLQIGMDPAMVCALSKPLAVGFRTSVVISFIGGTLRVALNGAVVCTQSYSGLDTVGPSQNAKVFAGSPWYEVADAEVHEVEYEQAGLDGTLPECEAVFCEGPLPTVPGARTDIPTGRGCTGQPHGFVCGDITCPNGTVLSSKFVCGGFGTWLGQTAEVRCVEVTCSTNPPALLGSDPLMYCNDRRFGDVCAMRCAPGYTNSGAFTCVANGSWIPLPGATPGCTPKPCGEAPLVLHGISGDMERCSQLPSGTTCVIGCSPPFIPLGQYRCTMQLWTEVPICVQREDVEGQANTWIIKAALSAEPSSEVQQRLPNANDWAKNVALAASQALSQRFTTLAGKYTSVHVLAYVGSGYSRRLQGSSIRPQTWRADVSFVVVPNGTAKADAQMLAAGFSALEPTVLEVLLKDALPTHATPDFILTRLSAALLGQLPADVAAQLSKVSPLSLSTEEEEETFSSTSTTPPEASSNDSNSSQSENEDDGGVVFALVKDGGDTDDGVSFWGVLIFMCAPLAFCMGCYMCYKYRRYNGLQPSEALPHEHGDWQKCIQSWQHEDVMVGIDDKMLSDFISKQAAEQRRAALKSSMAAEKRHEHQKQAAAQDREDGNTGATTAREGNGAAHVPHAGTSLHGHKSVKQVAQEFRDVAEKAKQGIKDQRAEARRHCCVRLTVFIEKACCPRKKTGHKRAQLVLASVGDADDDEEEGVEIAADHDPYAQGLQDQDSSDSGGELTDFEKSMEKDDEDSQANEDEERAMLEQREREQQAELQAIEVVDDDKLTFSAIGFQLEADLNPDTVYAKLMSGIRAVRNFRLAKLADRVVPRLRNSQVMGSTFTFIFNALNIHTPSENLKKVDKGDVAAEHVEVTAEGGELEIEDDDDRQAPKVPPSLLWEGRHFGGKIVVHSMLFTDEEEHHHGHWISEDRFTCHINKSTFVARFTDVLVHTYLIPDSVDHKTCLTCESNPSLEAVHEEHEIDHRDFFDFHGCDKLQPVWEHAAAFYDHRMEGKLKAAREAHNTGSSHSEKAGNKVRLHKEIRIDYVNMCSIETVTTEFRTPNRLKVQPKGKAVTPGKGTADDDESLDDFDSEEELEQQDAEHEKKGHEHHHHEKKKETLDDQLEQAESESAVSKSDTMSSSEGSHHGGVHKSQDLDEELKDVAPTPEVLAAVAKAQAAPLFQDLSEKHRSKAAKEHMGLNEGAEEGFFGGLADAFENAIDGDDNPTPGGTAFGAGIWGMITGGGPPASRR